MVYYSLPGNFAQTDIDNLKEGFLSFVRPGMSIFQKAPIQLCA